VLPNLSKGINLLCLVVPDQKLAFQNALSLECTLYAANRQAFSDDTVQPDAVVCGVSATLREDLDLTIFLLSADVDSAVLVIILALDADTFLADHAAAMSDASSFVTRRWADHHSDPRLDAMTCRLLQKSLDIFLSLYGHFLDDPTVQRGADSCKRILKMQKSRNGK
jgi:hypothetical protein